MVELPSGQVLLGNEGISAGISNASNTSPITITTGSTDGLLNGDTVTVGNATGNTAANGTWTISNVTATTFQLDGSSGNGAYTGNGFWQSGTRLQIYTPVGSPQNSWRPVITNIVDNGNGTFTLTGTQLNGISEGANYGDDLESASNYPIVQLTDSGGNISYATTTNWSSTGVATGSTPETTQFTLPSGTHLSDFTSLKVIANGIPSLPFPALASPNVIAPSNQSSVEGASESFNLGSFIDPSGSSWTVDVNWGDGTPDTTFSASPGPLGTQSHTYGEEGNYTPMVTVTDTNNNLSGSASFQVAVSDPAVVQASALPISPVEGAQPSPRRPLRRSPTQAAPSPTPATPAGLSYVWGGRDLRAVAPRSDSANFPGFFSILCSVFRDSVVTIFRVIS